MLGIGTFLNRDIITSGCFYCPACADDQNYLHLRFTKRITVLWMRVFTLSGRHHRPTEQIQCGACETAYATEIIADDASVDVKTFNQRYRVLVRKIMIHMTLADQVIDESEIEVCAKTWHQYFAEPLDIEQFKKDLLTETDSQEILLRELESMLPALDRTAKLALKSIMETIANADGEFHDLERLFYQRICSRLDQ